MADHCLATRHFSRRKHAWLIGASLLALAACGQPDSLGSKSGATKAPASPSISQIDQQRERSPTVDVSVQRRAQPSPAAEALVTADASMLPEPEPLFHAPIASSDEKYENVESNPVSSVAEAPVSTFSIDVDTAAYANARRFLRDGMLPPPEAVRVEEMINYFDYDYDVPDDRETPFGTMARVIPTPWNPDTKLLHIGIKGYDAAPAARPNANLVFLIDVSGSMDSPDKLPLVKQTVSQLVAELENGDSVAIVTYAGNAGTVLEPTDIRDRDRILRAIETLWAGGSTAGGEGIRQAYALAERNFDPSAVNRVILATDGDFNVGITDPDELEDYIAGKRDSGVYLSVLGFGTGNLNDLLMQKLAQAGNGNAAYIDSLMEGRKVLVEEASSTLFPIADDVKIQVEFNPARVAEYRLIGYETRALQREDFANDRIDAGEIGSGHEVTAIYEITPPDSPARLIEPLRYGTVAPAAPAAKGDEYAFLRIRYKLPDADHSRLIERPITLADGRGSIDEVEQETRFAVAVAAFGQLLRGDPHIGGFDFDDVVALAQPARGADEFGYRAEFVQLARLAGAATSQAALR
jgi:Ca-activated chloride channel family protein